MQYIQSNNIEERELLSACGVDTFSDLIRIIPSKFKKNISLGIGAPLAEVEIERELQHLSDKNKDGSICFIGRGIYDHFIPKAIDFLSNRSEYYTAYTPYQPEVSQGTLQYLYEYQSMICELSGMDIANASLYDGASALAEACFLALSVSKKSKIAYSTTVSDHFIKVMKSYLSGKKVEFIGIPAKNGITDLASIGRYLDGLSAVIIQSPNKYGLIEDWKEAKNTLIHSEALLIASGDPLSLSVLKSPGECGADVYIGDGQTLGNPMNFGGPLLGIFAVKEQFKRKIPGRIVGKTIDCNGKDGFVLTLQTREQHIRQEKATSNICTNQSLLALRATIYMALMGKNGMPYVSTLCFEKAQYAADQINKLSNYTLKYDNHFLKEFVIQTKHNVKALTKYCAENGLLILDIHDYLSSCFQIAVTEKRTKEEIDRLVKYLKNYQ